MRIRPIAITAAFAIGLATMPLSTAEEQSNTPQYYPRNTIRSVRRFLWSGRSAWRAPCSI